MVTINMIQHLKYYKGPNGSFPLIFLKGGDKMIEYILRSFIAFRRANNPSKYYPKEIKQTETVGDVLRILDDGLSSKEQKQEAMKQLNKMLK